MSEELIDAAAFRDNLTDFLNKFKVYTSSSNEMPGNYGDTNDSSGNSGYNVSTYVYSDKATVAIPDIDAPQKNQLAVASTIIDILVSIVNAFRNLHNVEAIWKYNNNGSFSTVKTIDKYFNSIDYVSKRTGRNSEMKGQTVLTPTSPEAGQIMSHSQLLAVMDDLYNKWVSGITEGWYSVTTCHYNCHSNYVNRARR